MKLFGFLQSPSVLRGCYASLCRYSVKLDRPDPAVAQTGGSGATWDDLMKDLESLDPSQRDSEVQKRLEGVVQHEIESGRAPVLPEGDRPKTRQEWEEIVKKEISLRKVPNAQVGESTWVDYTPPFGANVGPIVALPKEYRGILGVKGPDAKLEFMPAFPKAKNGFMTGYLVEQQLELYKHRFWRLYPRRVRQWLFDGLFPKGMFDERGNWVEGGYRVDFAAREWLKSPVFTLPPTKSTDDTVAGEIDRTLIPSDLRGRYRWNVTDEDLKEVDANSKLKRLLGFEFATQAERRAQRVKDAVAKFGDSTYDTGNTAVQVASLTLRIRDMMKHLQTNVKDSKMKRSLEKIVSHRRKLLRYLKRTNMEKYYQVLTEYRLRDMV